jgi:hypothetical protein
MLELNNFALTDVLSHDLAGHTTALQTSDSADSIFIQGLAACHQFSTSGWIHPLAQADHSVSSSAHGAVMRNFRDATNDSVTRISREMRQKKKSVVQENKFPFLMVGAHAITSETCFERSSLAWTRTRMPSTSTRTTTTPPPYTGSLTAPSRM